MTRVKITDEAIFIYEKKKIVAMFTKKQQQQIYYCGGKSYTVEGDTLSVSGGGFFQDKFSLKNERDRKVRLDTIGGRGVVEILFDVMMFTVFLIILGISITNDQLRKDLDLATGTRASCLKGPVGHPGPLGLRGPDVVYKDTLYPGQSIFETEMRNKDYKVSLIDNCAIKIVNVHDKTYRKIWLPASGCKTLKMQMDGNLVAYDGSSSVWATNTVGLNTHLKLTNKGQLHLLNQRNEIVYVL